MIVQHFQCTTNEQHIIAVNLPADKRQHERWMMLFARGKRVCPYCKPTNSPLVPCDPPTGKFSNDKLYHCSKGHVTKAYAFTNGYCGVEWGSDIEEHANMKTSPPEMMAKITNGEIKCRAVVLGKNDLPRLCNCKLKPTDDAILALPDSYGIKTKTRVGDVWDSAKCPRPQDSHYRFVTKKGQKDAEFVVTEFDKRNKKRVDNMRRERNSPMKKGRRKLKKPTDKNYRDRSPRRPRKNEI